MGALNTMLGLSVIYGLMLLAVHAVVSNLIGYAAGLALAFTLNRSWTFRVKFARAQVLKYILAFLISYGLNLAILKTALTMLHMNPFLAQLPALATYTASFFLLSKHYVFHERDPNS